MRKEADDIGPKAELDHWKKRMAKFNSLLDQIKGQECKAALGVMIAAKSKLIKVFKTSLFLFLSSRLCKENERSFDMIKRGG